jgi:hypothetical protein
MAITDGFNSSAHGRNLVAVVTPVYRLPLAVEEHISLRHLNQFLGRFDRFIIGPRGVLREAFRTSKEFAASATRTFPDQYFRSIQGYSQLLVSDEFYRAFAAYEYILIYQLDCLVFSGDLEPWCLAGWDYVGAPWFKDTRDDVSDGFWAVGNGGLSLRNVSSALRVLTSTRLLDDPKARGLKTHRFWTSPHLNRTFIALRTLLLQHGYHNNVSWLVRELGKDPNFHEDFFWAFHARRVAPDFRIPTPQQALSFSFEAAPRYCFQANCGRLPFGCHAWAKHDRQFWEPFLLK